MKRVAVVLSGSGHRDGSEITEAVCTLLSLSEMRADYQCFALDAQIQVIDHLTFEKTSEKRNILHEAARIARGKVKSIAELDADHFDALVFPGGMGAALHLTTWASDGSSCAVHPEVQRIVEEFNEQGKPIGAICIAPAILAKVLGHKNVTITLGSDESAPEVEKTGAFHEECPASDFVTDRNNKVVTTPAYMWSDAKPFDIYTGIRKMIKELIEMA